VKRPSDTHASTELENDLWTFANSFYLQEGVAPACLLLQDRFALNVNVLLLGLFALLRRGISLSTEDLSTACDLVDLWHKRIVKPLRDLRIRLKTGPKPAPSAATSELRGHIKAVELEAERIELATLADCLSRHTRSAPTADGVDTVLTRVVFHFAGKSTASLSDPDVDAALRKLVVAAEPFGRGASGRSKNTRP
jgi:uncharacterized protein (TIGR02444 family)